MPSMYVKFSSGIEKPLVCPSDLMKYSRLIFRILYYLKHDTGYLHKEYISEMFSVKMPLTLQ